MARPPKKQAPNTRSTLDVILEEAYPQGDAILGSGDELDLFVFGPDLDLPRDMEATLLRMYAEDAQLRWAVEKRRQEWIKKDPERPERKDPPWIERIGNRAARTAG
jgi:hypothetical protein